MYAATNGKGAWELPKMMLGRCRYRPVAILNQYKIAFPENSILHKYKGNEDNNEDNM